MGRLQTFRVIGAGLAAALALAGCGGAKDASPTARAAGSGSKPTAASLCATFSNEDFRAVGLSPDLDKPDVNPDTEGVGAYCTYTRKSGANGGIEFDVFLADEPKQVQETILGEAQGKMSPAGIKDVDESLIGTSITSGGGPFATTVVRKGKLVFTIAIPTGPKAQDQLVKLSELALQRLSSSLGV